jgi:endonuclease G, mitochondrial
MRSFASALVGALALLLALPAWAASIDEQLRHPDRLLAAECPARDSLRLPKGFFSICYQTDWRVARWVAYHLTAADLEGNVPRSNDFREDPAIENEALRSTLADYRGSGYARGHQAPAEDFDRSRIAMSTTFLLSNMAPQTAQLNSGKWSVLEAEARKVAEGHRGAWIFTGSIFARETRARGETLRRFEAIDPLTRARSNSKAWLRGRVAVPTHSFKAILVARADGTWGAYGFIMPNQRERLVGGVPFYQASIDEIERLIGIDLFADLDKGLENRLEGDVPAWPPKRERRR